MSSFHKSLIVLAVFFGAPALAGTDTASGSVLAPKGTTSYGASKLHMYTCTSTSDPNAKINVNVRSSGTKDDRTVTVTKGDSTWKFTQQPAGDFTNNTNTEGCPGAKDSNGNCSVKLGDDFFNGTDKLKLPTSFGNYECTVSQGIFGTMK